jgi:hypothetical protein
LAKTAELLKQITGNQARIDKGKRRKREELNFERESSKIFYGAMTLQRTPDLLSMGNAQKGVLQPQIILIKI